jgi:secreted PhoX family phosphatase
MAPVDLNDRSKNAGLLDDGTPLCRPLQRGMALDWLPLVFGQGPLTARRLQ